MPDVMVYVVSFVVHSRCNAFQFGNSQMLCALQVQLHRHLMSFIFVDPSLKYSVSLSFFKNIFFWNISSVCLMALTLVLMIVKKALLVLTASTSCCLHFCLLELLSSIISSAKGSYRKNSATRGSCGSLSRSNNLYCEGVMRAVGLRKPLRRHHWEIVSFDSTKIIEIINSKCSIIQKDSIIRVHCQDLFFLLSHIFVLSGGDDDGVSWSSWFRKKPLLKSN